MKLYVAKIYFEILSDILCNILKSAIESFPGYAVKTHNWPDFETTPAFVIVYHEYDHQCTTTDLYK